MDDDTTLEGDALAGTQYRTILRLGQSAAGEVLLAEHGALRRRVVVKVIAREHAEDARVADRLRLEAQSLAALDHPNLVAALDFGATRDGRPFLVVQHVEGATLEDRIKREGPLEAKEAVRVLREVLAGLAAAHKIGVVHRDLSPNNVLITKRGEVKLIDFGLAKVLTEERGAPPPLALSTETDTPLGSPRFFSPEQARREPTDARSDLYAAGALLTFLLTGLDPFFDVHGLGALLIAHGSRKPPPPSMIASKPTPTVLDVIALTALEKRPEDRYASADEMSAALGAALVALERPSKKKWEATMKMPPPEEEAIATQVFTRAQATTAAPLAAADSAPRPITAPSSPARRSLLPLLLAAVALALGAGIAIGVQLR
jgi:serine/threonine-protein kinase